jgi:acyl-homoserine-lactone acylase
MLETRSIHDGAGQARPLRAIAALLTASACLLGATVRADDMTAPSGATVAAASADYVASVRRGPWGVAHISADDFGSLGYGEGFAAAEDHVCTIAHALLQARGESARYLGPGADNANIANDALMQALRIGDQAQAAFEAQSADIQQWLEGYSAGFNRYLREHRGSRNDSWCSGADWLVETTPLDFMSRMVALALTLPRVSMAIAAAAPPDTQLTAGRFELSEAGALAALDGVALSGMGSNGWALGRERTENGRGVLLANPHYPWYGPNRFWEKHLTIPGRLDVYGVVTLGAPGVAIGFNRHLGWTHTVSASQRLVFYRLPLDPKNPLRYRFGDDWRDIDAREIVVPVRDENGETSEHRHTLYFSHYGPLLKLPNMDWSEEYAYSVRDANIGNYSLLAQWKAMGEASNMDDFIDAHRQYNAMPWVNTMAASADGRAVYLDNSSVGNLSRDAQERWRASLAQDRLAAELYAERDFILLDGSEPENQWIETGDSPIPGTVPFDERPLLERSDYVFNANDSYWLTNPAQPLSGYSILYGATDSPRSVRTRMNVRLLENAYNDAGEDGRFSIEEVQKALFANRGLTAELLLPGLITRCQAAEPTLASACAVLEGYDGTLNLDSPGAVLFREWLTRYAYDETLAAGSLFAEDFDADEPVTTPRSLGDQDRAIEELEKAIAVLESAGLALDATLRDAQFAWRNGEAIPVHGGNRAEGVANLQIAGNPAASPIAGVTPETVADSRFLTDAGYPIVHGSSFILTLGFDDDGPVAEALLSYSQSGNPNAPHFRDQTELYARKQWREVAFDAKDVQAATRSIRVLRSADER